MTLDTAEVLWVLNLIEPKTLSDIAVQLLSQGVDCHSLRLLAGLTSKELTDASSLFEQVLKELKRPIMSKKNAALSYTRLISDQILQGTISPYDGARKILEVNFSLNPPLDEVGNFIYAVSEYDERPEDRDFFISEIIKEAKRWRDGTRGTP